MRGGSRTLRGRTRPLARDVYDLDDADDELEVVVPRPPSLGSAIRSSLTDLYFNSWRLAPANLIWGAVLVAALLAGPRTLLGFVLLVALSLPTAGIHRLGALIARGQPAALSDFFDGMRRSFGPALVVGAGAVASILVLTTNLLVGIGSDNPIGWFIAAMALWGLVGLAMVLVAFWPILADPRREGLSLGRRLALAGMTVIGRPVRMLVLTVVVGIVLLVSTILFAVLLLVAVAFVSLVSSRHVLPTVDELESRLIR